MTSPLHTNEHDAVDRLFELSCSGEVENPEFLQLGRQVYESMFETYRRSAADGVESTS